MHCELYIRCEMKNKEHDAVIHDDRESKWGSLVDRETMRQINGDIASGKLVLDEVHDLSELKDKNE